MLGSISGRWPTLWACLPRWGQGIDSLEASIPNFDRQAWENDGFATVEASNPSCKSGPYFSGALSERQIPWAKNQKYLAAWEHGRTGYPYIDAAMRQLHRLGWMHHLARHAVACFLTRGDLWISWEEGRDIFDRLLLDADWSLNNMNWLALSGAAPWSPPFFRVYHPAPRRFFLHLLFQVPKMDSSLNVKDPEDFEDVSLGRREQGKFIREFVPELSKMPSQDLGARAEFAWEASGKYIYAPWTAPKEAHEMLASKVGFSGGPEGCRLHHRKGASRHRRFGLEEDYPKPIVDHDVVVKAVSE